MQGSPARSRHCDRHLAEHGIEKIVRDPRVHQILEGTDEIMNVIVPRGLTGAA